MARGAVVSFPIEQEIGPLRSGFAITPSDSENFSRPTRAIYVGAAGNVVVVWADGTTSTFMAVPAGSLLPISVVRVNNTNTSAGSLLGFLISTP